MFSMESADQGSDSSPFLGKNSLSSSCEALTVLDVLLRCDLLECAPGLGDSVWRGSKEESWSETKSEDPVPLNSSLSATTFFPSLVIGTPSLRATRRREPRLPFCTEARLFSLSLSRIRLCALFGTLITPVSSRRGKVRDLSSAARVLDGRGRLRADSIDGDTFFSSGEFPASRRERFGGGERELD